MTLKKLTHIPPKLLIGPVGPRGERGEQGPQGPKGDPGERGPQGDRGEQGAPGLDGRDGLDGKQGDTPSPVWEGTRLNWRVGEKLIKGPDLKGDKGEKGSPGESGGAGAGATPSTQTLYEVTVATSSLSAGMDGNRIILVDASSGDVTVTMPRANRVKGLVYHVKKTDSSTNDVIIQPQNSELIDGEDCFIIERQNTNFMIVSDGTAYYVI